MNSPKTNIAPEHTEVRVALWRALHAQIDSKPSIFIDDVGLKLVADDNWRSRPDMNPEFSKSMRASIVGRARFIENLVEEQIQQGIAQYVILGAGLDSFAQRRPELSAHLQIFEVDQPGPQIWKQNRLKELGFVSPSGLHFVPVDFEAGTPFHSLFHPSEILDLANQAGFKTSSYMSAIDLHQLYFANRPDGLNAGTAEGFLLATT